jgi:hypothetical protein
MSEAYRETLLTVASFQRLNPCTVFVQREIEGERLDEGKIPPSRAGIFKA